MTAVIDSHAVRVVVDGKEVGGWESYEISQSMRTPSDAFSLSRPFDRAAWDLLRPDRPIKVLIDEVVVLTGFIDDSEKSDNGADSIMISGRDKVGRLVQESAPSVSYKGLTERDLIARVAAPWFTAVTNSNARNRKLVRGRGRQAAVGDEPIRLDTRGGTTIEPGQARWAVIEELLRQSGHLAWSSGDGRELIVGLPNYNQAIQWSIFHPSDASVRGIEGNALAFGIKRSTGDRYSRIVVVGSGAGTDANYGASVSSRYGEAKDNPLTPDGDGTTFSAPKRLVMVEDVQSRAEAVSIAKREMARRALDSLRINATLPLHGQVLSGARRALFALDTMARVEDEVTGLAGAYLIDSLQFTGSRQAGQQTRLSCIPRGTEVFL